jgi:beta-glucanase (GH16 family)
MLRKRHVAFALIALVVGALLAASPAAASTNFDGSAAQGLLWSDEFNGITGAAPDPVTWAYDQGPYGSNGQGELECYTNSRQNSALDGFGDLVITVRSAPNTSCWPIRRDYTSARLTTQNKITLQYGRVEVRATMPTTTGMFPAIWALGNNYSKARSTSPRRKATPRP